MPGRVRADAQGRFRLSGLPAGMAYQLTYFPPGKGLGWPFGPKTSLQPGQTVDVGIWVSRPDQPLAPQGQAASSGEAAPGGAGEPPPQG
jgi:hypothetical protein